MFELLSEGLEQVFRKLGKRGKLSESDVRNCLRDIRRVLLEADVNYKVTREFIERVGEKAIGAKVLKSLTPAQQVIKIVYDELTYLMGGSAVGINFSPVPPTVIMLVGLQGGGKTTVAAKLARYFRSKGKSPMLVAVDTRRPAAVEQLRVLGLALDVPVHSPDANTDPIDICTDAVTAARRSGLDLLILDTAGRLHVDQEMMEELVKIRERVRPHEILLVADGMTGQDAVNIAGEFHERLGFDGVILTKLDGDARGGAALSIRTVTGKPIKFVGVGEKVDALEVFHPERMASRILGMGDLPSLVEKAQEAVDIEKAKELEEKLRKETFTFDDFLEQLRQVKRLGPLDQLLDLIPGAGQVLKGLKPDERALIRTEAIINSMTKEERRKPHIIDGSRRKRIAMGSGTSVQEVNSLLKQFSMIQKMARKIGKMKVGRTSRPMFPF